MHPLIGHIHMDHLLAPKATASRAEVSTIFMNYLQKVQ